MELLTDRAKAFAAWYDETLLDYTQWVRMTNPVSEKALAQLVDQRSETVAGHVARLGAMISMIHVDVDPASPSFQFWNYVYALSSHTKASVFTHKLHDYKSRHRFEGNVSKLYVGYALRSVRAFKSEQPFKVRQTVDGFHVEQCPMQFQVKRTPTGYTARKLEAAEVMDCTEKVGHEQPLILEQRWIRRIILDTTSELLLEMYQLRDSIERLATARIHNEMFPPPSIEELREYFSTKKRAREASETQTQTVTNPSMRGHGMALTAS